MDANDVLLQYLERIDARVESIDAKLDQKATTEALAAHTAQDDKHFTELRTDVKGIYVKVALIVGVLVGSGILAQEIWAAMLG